ncbi:MAG: holo-ACP synthase [Chloroflexota bacterium]|nr:holo-ACP synthase [Chloroflexota bacterium]
MSSEQAIHSNDLADLHFACGVDITELDAFARALQHGGKHFLKRVYTKAELDFCRGRLPQLAARFAAKEAVSKALGTGLRGISWNDIEVLSTQEGCPYVSLYGRAEQRAKYMGLHHWRVSLSHSEHLAIAFVIASHIDLRASSVVGWQTAGT